MSEIKPVYQYKTSGMLINYWQDVDEEIFVKINKDQFYTTRILYPAAAYEALQKERDLLQAKVECLEGQNKLTQLKCHGEEETVKRIAAHSEVLQKEVTHWKANHADLKERLHVATHRTDLPSDRLPLFDKMKAEIAALQKENAELKRIQSTDAIDFWNLTEQNAAQAKRIAELETPLTDAQIASAYLSHRHDFGLLTDFQRISIFNTAKSLEECFRKERELLASKNGE